MSIDWSKRKTKDDLKQNRLKNLAEGVRKERDRLISQTDYLFLSDTPQPTQELIMYRQKLRDITKQSGFPENIKWPEYEN